MRQFLGKFTPMERGILVCAIALAGIVGGFITPGDVTSPLDASNSVDRSEISTTTVSSRKVVSHIAIGDCDEDTTTFSSTTAVRTVFTED